MNPERGTPNAAAPTPQSLTLVCFALPDEAAPFRRRAKARSGLRIRVSGMGPVNAQRSIRTALTETPCPIRVLTCGYAGALDAELAIGSLVFFTDSDAPLAQQLSALGAKSVRFHCANRVAVTAAEKAQLRRTSGADAVEMESGVIQSFCREAGVPCTTLRAISDRADEDLPLDFNQFARADHSLDFPKLLLAIAKSPGKIGTLLKLQRQCRLAALRLADALEQVVGSPSWKIGGRLHPAAAAAWPIC